MAKRSAAAPDDYWKKRLASPAFRRTHVGGHRRGASRKSGGCASDQMLDPRIVRDVIRHWDVRVADQAALAGGRDRRQSPRRAALSRRTANR